MLQTTVCSVDYKQHYLYVFDWNKIAVLNLRGKRLRANQACHTFLKYTHSNPPCIYGGDEVGVVTL